MPCRADALAIGILAALLWRTESFRKWLHSHGWVLYTLAGVFFSGFVTLGRSSPDNVSLPMESIGYSWIAIFYGLVLLLVLEKRAAFLAAVTRARPLRELGRVSYCFYLLHYGLGWLMWESMAVLVRNPGPWAFAAASCIAAFVVYALAWVSWRNIEYPLLRLGQAYRY